MCDPAVEFSVRRRARRLRQTVFISFSLIVLCDSGSQAHTKLCLLTADGAAGASCVFFSPTIMDTCSEWFIPFAVYVRYYHISRYTRTTGYTLCVNRSGVDDVCRGREDEGGSFVLASRSRNSTGFVYVFSLFFSSFAVRRRTVYFGRYLVIKKRPSYCTFASSWILIRY